MENSSTKITFWSMKNPGYSPILQSGIWYRKIGIFRKQTEKILIGLCFEQISNKVTLALLDDFPNFN